VIDCKNARCKTEIKIKLIQNLILILLSAYIVPSPPSIKTQDRYQFAKFVFGTISWSENTRFVY